MKTDSGKATLADLDIVLATGRPAVIVAPRPADLAAARDWLSDHRTAIREALHRFGSVVIRGIPLSDAAGFAAARDELLDQRVPYREKSTPRTDFGDGVYTSTDMPAMHPIRLHNENSYVLEFPGVLLFGCVTAPDEGGATTVGDSRALLDRIDPAVRDRAIDKGWTLYRSYHPNMSLPWSTAFGTADRAELEDYFRDRLISWHWRAGDGLLTSQRRSAVVTHPETGERTWFNHIAFWNRYTLDPAMREVLLASYGEHGLPYDTAYGDGRPLEEAEIEHLNEVYDGIELREQYRAGDLLMVDNLLSCHGREPFRGDRKILVAMGEPRALADCAPVTPPAAGPLPE
jgi:alpha-ketoglutarate-dependent taurine dioxygenase